MQYHKTVFEKYGLKITSDPFPKNFTAQEEDAVNYVYQLINSQKKGKKLIQEVKEYKEEYSNLPEMYNYLGGVYISEGKEKEAIAIIKETIRRFPDYEFGKLQWAELNLKRNKPEEVPKILGLDTEINQFANEEGFIHFSFYLSFFIVQGKYFLAADNISKAKECLGKILTYDEKTYQAEILGSLILQHTLQSIGNQFKEVKKFQIKVESKATYNPLQINIKPTFFHSEIELFYKNSLHDITVAEIEKIIQLPKESLTKDLELVVEDAIVRYQWFFDNYEAHYEEEQSAVYHALNFLCGLKSEQSLQKVLNLLRQTDEFLDFWFDDPGIYLKNYLFSISKNNLREFQSFVYEPYVNYRGKSLVIDIISQCYFYYPEAREEILSIIKEMSDFFLETKDDSLLDSGVISALIAFYLDHNLKEFIPYVEKFFDNNWLDDMMFGNKEQTIKDINSADSIWSKDVFPDDVFEDYSGVYRNRKEKSNPTSFIKEEEKDVMNFLMGMIFKREFDDEDEYSYEADNYEVAGTYKRELPKVGRNEPCPCGSGKKYKKCCINK